MVAGRAESLAVEDGGSAVVRNWGNWLRAEEEPHLHLVEGVDEHIQFVFDGKESVLYVDLFLPSAYVVDHDHDDGDLGDLGGHVVGHRVHSHGNHGHGEGVQGEGVQGEGAHGGGVHGEGAHGDSVHEGHVHGEGVHGAHAHWNYDCEEIYGFRGCQKEGDDTLAQEAAVVVCLS